MRGKRRKRYLICWYRDWPANRYRGQKSHVTLSKKAGSVGGARKGSISKRGSANTEREGGRRVGSVQLTDSVERGPMGGRGQVPTSAARWRTAQRRTRGEGSPIPQLKFQRTVHSNLRNGLVRVFDGDDRGATPSTAKVKNSHECNACIVGKGSGNPAERPENSPIGANMY